MSTCVAQIKSRTHRLRQLIRRTLFERLSIFQIEAGESELVLRTVLEIFSYSGQIKSHTHWLRQLIRNKKKEIIIGNF